MIGAFRLKLGIGDSEIKRKTHLKIGNLEKGSLENQQANAKTRNEESDETTV